MMATSTCSLALLKPTTPDKASDQSPRKLSTKTKPHQTVLSKKIETQTPLISDGSTKGNKKTARNGKRRILSDDKHHPVAPSVRSISPRRNRYNPPVNKVTPATKGRNHDDDGPTVLSGGNASTTYASILHEVTPEKKKVATASKSRIRGKEKVNGKILVGRERVQPKDPAARNTETLMKMNPMRRNKNSSLDSVQCSLASALEADQNIQDDGSQVSAERSKNTDEVQDTSILEGTGSKTDKQSITRPRCGTKDGINSVKKSSTMKKVSSLRKKDAKKPVVTTLRTARVRNQTVRNKAKPPKKARSKASKNEVERAGQKKKELGLVLNDDASINDDSRDDQFISSSLLEGKDSPVRKKTYNRSTVVTSNIYLKANNGTTQFENEDVCDERSISSKRHQLINFIDGMLEDLQGLKVQIRQSRDNDVVDVFDLQTKFTVLSKGDIFVDHSPRSQKPANATSNSNKLSFSKSGRGSIDGAFHNPTFLPLFKESTAHWEEESECSYNSVIDLGIISDSRALVRLAEENRYSDEEDSSDDSSSCSKVEAGNAEQTANSRIRRSNTSATTFWTLESMVKDVKDSEQMVALKAPKPSSTNSIHLQPSPLEEIALPIEKEAAILEAKCPPKEIMVTNWDEVSVNELKERALQRSAEIFEMNMDGKISEPNDDDKSCSSTDDSSLDVLMLEIPIIAY